MRHTIVLAAILFLATATASNACFVGSCGPSSSWKLVYQPTGLQAQYAAIKSADTSPAPLWIDCPTSGSLSVSLADRWSDPNTPMLRLNAAYRIRLKSSERETSITAHAVAIGNRLVLQTEAITDKPFLASLKKSKRFVLFIEHDAQDRNIFSIPFYGANLTKFYESCGI